MQALMFARYIADADGGASGGARGTEFHGLPDDLEIVRRVRLGDVALFAQVFRTYAPKLASFAYRYLRSRDDAEDIVQELFLRIWRGRERWQVRGSVNDYLYLAIRNQARNRLAHRAVVDRHRDQEIQNLSHGSDKAYEEPIGWNDEDEWQAMLTRAIDELPPRRREICILRWRDGLSYTEIAQRMGVSTKTVENQLARALKGLRERLGNLSS